ncbi:MAG: alginate lyase family protein [Sphingomicrobium sp.]
MIALRLSATRLLAFARHVPPRQLARRVQLRLRTAIEAQLTLELRVEPSVLSRRAPHPLFSPRTRSAERTATGWTFTFLHRRESCPAAIDWKLGGPGAANQLWRMNLHYFEWIEALADAEMIDAIDQWITACPPYAPGAHRDSWNAYALSLRVVVWLQQLAIRRARLTEQWTNRVTASLTQQLVYLERHLETDIGGNHLFKNISALLWGSVAIETAAAARWRDTGLKLLRRELGQILPDGMQFERSASYHNQVLGDLLDIRHALGRDPYGGALDGAIVAAAQVAADLTHPDGGPALFGDAGLTMARGSRELREAARSITGQSFAPRPAFDLPAAGYAGLRSVRDLLICDAGPLGPDRLPGHAHGDLGSFEWSVAGRRLIVDQGVYTYVEGDRRKHARSAANHNTLAAPLADQADFFGSFRMGRRCHIASRSAEVSEKFLRVDVSHDGFVGRNGGARHRRLIEARPDEIVITDHIDRDLAGAAVSFLVAPDVEVRPVAGGVELFGPTAHCRIASSGEVTIEDAVWWPDMGVERDTRRVRIALHGRHLQTTLSVLARKEA